ncbi:MAG: hypothetical protein ACT4P7_12995 [Gemmatimonadaceae bacterium]
MRHALVYHGGYERNFRTLAPGSTTFEGTDGAQHSASPWPTSANGLRVSYMEKAGKNFCAVRVADSEVEVTLANEVVLEPGRHFGYSVRLSGEPTLVEDDGAALVLVEDMIRKNHDAPGALLQIRERLKAAAKK